MASSHEACTKNTYRFIHYITNQTVATVCLLVTCDVISLYTNMFTETANNKVQQAFHDNPNDDRPSDIIIQLLRIICNGNDFKYNGNFYKQRRGLQCVNAFHPASAISTCWSLINLQLYTTHMETTWNKTTIDFLDTTIFKHQPSDGHTTLHTKPFFKPTGSHQLLHMSSFHPKHVARGVLKSQILRFKRIYTTRHDFNTACDTLFKTLRYRGYSRRTLELIKFNIWHDDKIKNH